LLSDGTSGKRQNQDKYVNGGFFQETSLRQPDDSIELLALRPPQTAVAFSVKVWHSERMPTFKRHQQWVDLSRNRAFMI
jgi:hypothetical protein